MPFKVLIGLILNLFKKVRTIDAELDYKSNRFRGFINSVNHCISELQIPNRCHCGR